MIAAASVALSGQIITTYGLTYNGLGRDIWTVSPDMITTFQEYFLAYEMIYYATMSLLKISLLFFYLRVFPPTTVHRVLWGTIAVAALYGVAFVVVTLAQCQPISYFWTRWDGQHTGTCVDIKAVAWMNACIGIALDVWMLAVPIYEIRTLKLHWRKKIAVVLMFSVGTL